MEGPARRLEEKAGTYCEYKISFSSTGRVQIQTDNHGRLVDKKKQLDFLFDSNQTPTCAKTANNSHRILNVKDSFVTFSTSYAKTTARFNKTKIVKAQRRRREIAMERPVNRTVLKMILCSGEVTYNPTFGWTPNDATIHILMFDEDFKEHVMLLRGKSVVDIIQLIHDLEHNELENMRNFHSPKPIPDTTSKPSTTTSSTRIRPTLIPEIPSRVQMGEKGEESEIRATKEHKVWMDQEGKLDHKEKKGRKEYRATQAKTDHWDQ